eukprot:2188551-Rhodomonas_salina.1
MTLSGGEETQGRVEREGLRCAAFKGVGSPGESTLDPYTCARVHVRACLSICLSHGPHAVRKAHARSAQPLAVLAANEERRGVFPSLRSAAAATGAFRRAVLSEQGGG